MAEGNYENFYARTALESLSNSTTFDGYIDYKKTGVLVYVNVRINHLNGSISDLGVSLPSGFRPSFTIRFPCVNGGGIASEIVIAPGGSISIYYGSDFNPNATGVFGGVVFIQ